MKLAGRRRFFYPIRAVLLLLICSLLLTGCGDSEEGIYLSSVDGAGICDIVKAETKVFDRDDVTLSFHFGFPPGGLHGGRLESGYFNCFKFYFFTDYRSDEDCFVFAIDPILVETVCDKNVMLACTCNVTDKLEDHNDVWFTLTVPTELFDAERGDLYCGLYGVLAKESAEDQKQEECCILWGFRYQKIDDGKIYILTSKDDFIEK